MFSATYSSRWKEGKKVRLLETDESANIRLHINLVSRFRNFFKRTIVNCYKHAEYVEPQSLRVWILVNLAPFMLKLHQLGYAQLGFTWIHAHPFCPRTGVGYSYGLLSLLKFSLENHVVVNRSNEGLTLQALFPHQFALLIFYNLVKKEFPQH